jgi:hypothetical protein
MRRSPEEDSASVNSPAQRSTNELRLSPPGAGAQRSKSSTKPDTLVLNERATFLARTATAGSMVRVTRFFIMHTLPPSMHSGKMRLCDHIWPEGR